MTVRDRNNIKRLYYYHNYLPNSLAKLFGLSHVRIFQILKEQGGESIINTALECLLCGNEDCQKFFIDGDTENTRPQNVIMICEYDARRLRHMQLRRSRLVLAKEPQSF